MQEAAEAVLEATIGAAIDVHRELGPGLLESAYECGLRGLRVARQVEIPLRYKGVALAAAYRADLIIEESLLIELKTVEKITDLHLAQTLTYLKLLKFKRGLILNFNVPVLRQGIRRVSL